MEETKKRMEGPSGEEPRFRFDSDKSVRANIEGLLLRANEVSEGPGGGSGVEVMLRHLIGAKLDILLGAGKVVHERVSSVDRPGWQSGDFQVETTVIHVSVDPSEALIGRCADNLRAGLRPVVISVWEGVSDALALLRGHPGLVDQVDVLDAIQFLTANVFERSLVSGGECGLSLERLLARYEEIVAE